MSFPELFGMSPQTVGFLFGLVIGGCLVYRERISVCHECERIDSGHADYCGVCGSEKEQRYAASVFEIVRHVVGAIFSVIGEIFTPSSKGDSR